MSNDACRERTNRPLLDRSSSNKRMLLAVLLLIMACLWFAMPHEVMAEQQLLSAHDHSSGSGESGTAGLTVSEFLVYAVRFAYYITLMLTSGLMLLSIAVPTDQSNPQRRVMNQWSLFAMRALLLASLVYVFVHANAIIRELGSDGGEQWLRLFRDTSVGNSWASLLVITLLGFLVLRLKGALKVLWAMLLLVVESYNGHALATDLNSTAIVFDFIHLLCASLWAGGVFFLLLLWYKAREETSKFAGRFTSIAWITIVVLVVSGIGLTTLILPSWRYLMYTDWGVWLLVKTMFVLGVVGLGVILRGRVKKRNLTSGKLLKLDGLLMSAIIVTVSVLTFISPEPNTEPFRYHEMGEDLHYTIAITPNAPGPNEVSLKVWLPEQLGAPADISLTFHSTSTSSKTIQVPLQEAQLNKDYSFPGFTEFNYAAAERIDLPFPGEWNAELVITDQSGGMQKRSILFVNE